jgi:hypothetical protein
MRAAALIAVTMLAAGAQPAVAFSPTPAEWLREACADDELYYSYGACAGYLKAALDRMPELGRPIGSDEEPDLYSGLGDLVAGTVGTLESIPGEDAASLAMRALETAYPCEE